MSQQTFLPGKEPVDQLPAVSRASFLKKRDLQGLLGRVKESLGVRTGPGRWKCGFS